jgi:hydrogenase nickel incorporation protein HypA/HybF
MHEIGVTQSLLDAALAQARQAGAGRVTAVHVVLGEQSGLAEEAVRWYWQSLSPGTAAEGAALHFRLEPAAWRCEDCGGRTEAPAERCPGCGGGRLALVAGHGLYLEAIEVE